MFYEGIAAAIGEVAGDLEYRKWCRENGIEYRPLSHRQRCICDDVRELKRALQDSGDEIRKLRGEVRRLRHS